MDRALRARFRWGRRKQNQLAALDVLAKIARGAADPPTAALGDSEILSEKCSMGEEGRVEDTRPKRGDRAAAPDFFK